MYKTCYLFFFICLFHVSYSQNFMGALPRGSKQQQKHCDTINIDKQFITMRGQRCTIDTSIHQEIKGSFRIDNSLQLSHNHLIEATKIDTVYSTYIDTILNDDNLVYLTDTSYDYSKCYIMIENIAEINKGKSVKVGDIIPLELISMYHTNTTELYGNLLGENNVVLTADCDHCYIFISNNVIEQLHACSILLFQIYRLKV